MNVFVFRSEIDRRQFAFTRDKAGANLPGELAPWYQSSGRAVPSIVGLPDTDRRAHRILLAAFG
jgi:hypothetical protein